MDSLSKGIMYLFIAIILLPLLTYLYQKLTLFLLPWAHRFKETLTFETIKKMESIRREYSVTHEAFEILVLSSAALGTKIIERDYERMKKLFPNRNETKILRDLLIDDFSKDPDLRGKDHERMAEEAMAGIPTLYQLTQDIENRERLKNPNYYESALGVGIEKIIREQ